MGITAIEVINAYANKIRIYRNRYGRDINLGIIPEVLTIEEIENVIDIMLKTGYTFLAAYLHTKDRTVQFMDINSVVNHMLDTPPSDKKLEKKMLGIHLGNISIVTLGRDNIIVDGLATYTLLKNNNELFIPYVYGCRQPVQDKYWVRKRLMSKQKNLCYICGVHMMDNTTEKNWYRQATIDHVIPLAKGGSNSENNYAMACSLCNNLKGSELLTPELKKEIKIKSKELALKYKEELH